jgi:CheY-like chemotaxis protein
LKGRAYKLPPELSWSNLNETIEEALNLIVVKASRHAVEIQKDDRIFDVQLYADSKRLVRAFLNIMSNAIDAMPNGGNLKITAENDGGYLRIEFSDTGMGIPEEDLHKVLDPFFTTKNQGYGLGLTITKRIVETDHRGKLILQSKQGQGTTVAVWLPLNLYSHPQNNNGSLNNSSNSKFRSINKAKIQTGNILVVNDDTIILNKITQLLGSEGHGVTGTESGKKAVQLCKRQKFDAIVLDYHLKKDHSATRTAIDFVPELKKNAPTTPIILTSATMDYLGAPAMYCDFFLEINHSFWNNILDLVKKCLIGEPKLSAESMTQI